MALGPKITTLTSEDTKRVDAFENEIDEKLRKFDSGGTNVFGLETYSKRNMTDTERSKVLEELRKRYIVAGWSKMEFDSEDRDNVIITLTP
ncbi:MAG: hypothetical protein AAB575_05865 [Patescibacteria group bacterium]